MVQTFRYFCPRCNVFLIFQAYLDLFHTVKGGESIAKCTEGAVRDAAGTASDFVEIIKDTV